MLGNHKNWGVAGWTRCPQNQILSHVAQDTARAWFAGVGAHCAGFRAFWRLFGPFLGHIVDLKGTRGLVDAVKSSLKCSVATNSLRLGVSPRVWGLFWTKKWLFLAQKCADLGGHLPAWPPRPGPPPVSFRLKTWIWQGHHLGSRMAKVESSPRRWEGAMAKTEW